MLPRRISDSFGYTAKSAMRDQITILAPNPGRADDGSSLAPYVFAAGVWAFIRPMRPTEVNTKELVQSEVYYDVRTPYLDGITSQMTIVAPNGAVWFVISVTDPDQRRVELRFICRSINDGGVENLVVLPTPPPYEPEIDGGEF